MEKIIKEIPLKEKEAIIHHDEGVDLIPSSIDLEALEVGMANVMNREYIMKNYIDKVKNKYDYVLIDCKPSLSMLVINALASADSVIIPVQTHFLSARGMTQLLQTINKVKMRINTELTVD